MGSYSSFHKRLILLYSNFYSKELSPYKAQTCHKLNLIFFRPFPLFLLGPFSATEINIINKA